MANYTITIVGMGYVGVPLAILFGIHHTVYAVDIDKHKVELINSGHSPIEDEYAGVYLKKAKHRIIATSSTHQAYSKADFIFVAVPTNYDSEKNAFDTSVVESVLN